MTRSRNGDKREPLAGGILSTFWYDREVEEVVRAESREPDTADYGFITDFLAAELSPADRERYEYRKQTDSEFRKLAESLERIWEMPGRIPPEPTHEDRRRAELMLQKVRRRRELEERGIHTLTLAEKRAKRRNWRVGLLATFATTLAVWFGWWVRPQLFPAPAFDVHVDAPASQERSATLRDRTQVTLAPASHLSHRPWFGDADLHTLTLDGEGTFIVTPGSRLPLVVDATNLEVTAFEGRFTVEAFSGMPFAYVKVHEGRVEVRAHNVVYGYGQVVTLRAGEGARVGPGIWIEKGDAPIASHGGGPK